MGALTPLILKGLAIGAATAAGKTVVNKIAGKGTRIISKKYEGDGTRIIGKLYEGEGTRIFGKLYEGEGTGIIGKVYGSVKKLKKQESKKDNNISLALGKHLTNFQIEDRIKSDKCFKGVFPKNILPKKINKLECGIVNNDSLPGNGTHWVCYYNHPKNKYVEFFDSFGLPPGKDIQRYLLTSNKDIMYNSSQIQDVLSIKCGYFCIDYIKGRLSGSSQYDCIHKYSINFYINDDLLCHL